MSSIPGLPTAVKDYNDMSTALAQEKAYYVAALASLVQLAKSGNPGLALWLFQLQCMPAITTTSEMSMQMESDALNIASDIRSDITNAQNDYNNLIQEIEKKAPSRGSTSTNGKHITGPYTQGQALEQALQKLKQDLNIPGVRQILGSANAENLSGFIENISGGIQAVTHKSKTLPPHTVYSYHTHPGHYSHGHKIVPGPCGVPITVPVCQWIPTTVSNIPHVTTSHVSWTSPAPGVGPYSWLRRLYNSAMSQHMIKPSPNGKPTLAPGGGTMPPEFAQITSAFNNLNQSVSGVSAVIQQNMQFLNNNLQEFFGIYKSTFDAYSQLNAYIVNKAGGGS